MQSLKQDAIDAISKLPEDADMASISAISMSSDSTTSMIQSRYRVVITTRNPTHGH